VGLGLARTGPICNSARNYASNFVMALRPTQQGSVCAGLLYLCIEGMVSLTGLWWVRHALFLPALAIQLCTVLYSR